jgi:hypothetical protein
LIFNIFNFLLLQEEEYPDGDGGGRWWSLIATIIKNE